MKKLRYLSTVFLLCSLSVCAQKPGTFRQIGAGIYAGPQLFGKALSGDKLSNVSGITAGLDLRYSFSPGPKGFSLHLQPGYNTFRQLTKEGAGTQVYRETTWRWEAFHVPLLARYTFSSGKFRPFAELGPTLRFRKALTIRNSGYYCGFAGCSNVDFVSDLQPETHKDVVLLTAGAGVEIDLWKVTVPISVRLQQGFNTFEMKEYRADAVYYDKMKTSTIQITAGIGF